MAAAPTNAKSAEVANAKADAAVTAARADLAVLVQHEVKVFQDMVIKKRMSMSFSTQPGAAAAREQPNLARYISLVKDQSATTDGTLELTWRRLFGAPGSAYSCAPLPLPAEKKMQRKQLAMRVCVMVSDELKRLRAPGATPLSPPDEQAALRKCILDVTAKTGVLHNHHINRNYACYVKESAEELVGALLKASLLRFVTRRCANSGDSFIEREVNRRHQNVWVKGSAGVRASKLSKQIDRVLRFGKFEQAGCRGGGGGGGGGNSFAWVVDLDAATESGSSSTPRKCLEEMLAVEEEKLAKKVESHKAAMRTTAELEEALQQLPHTAGTAELALGYSFCSGSVLPSSTPLPRAWELGPKLAEKVDSVILGLMEEVCRQFNETNDIKSLTESGKDKMKLLSYIADWFDTWRAGAGKELLSTAISMRGGGGPSKRLRGEYEAQLKKLFAAYAALYLAEGRVRNEARKEMETAMRLVLERTGFAHETFAEAVSALRLPESAYIEHEHILATNGGGSWARQSVVSGSLYRQTSHAYASERRAFVAGCEAAMNAELNKIPTFIADIDTQKIIATKLIEVCGVSRPPEPTLERKMTLPPPPKPNAGGETNNFTQRTGSQKMETEDKRKHLMSSEPKQTPAPHAEKAKAPPTVSNIPARDVDSSKKYDQAIFDKPKSFEEIMREKRARQQLEAGNGTETKAADTKSDVSIEKADEPQSKKPKTEKTKPAPQPGKRPMPSTSKQVEAPKPVVASAPASQAAPTPTPVPKKPAPSIPKKTKQKQTPKEEVKKENDTNGKSTTATPPPPPSGTDGDADAGAIDAELAELDALFS